MKRILFSIMERVESADKRLATLERELRHDSDLIYLANAIRDVRNIDILDALRDLEYALERAE